MNGPWLCTLVGAVCGVLSGFGIGGGSLLMIWLTALQDLPQRQAQGINLLYFLPTAGTSLLFHIKNKLVAWQAALPAIACGCLSAAGSAWLAQSLHAALLRRLFGGFLLAVGILELRKARKQDEDAR